MAMASWKPPYLTQKPPAWAPDQLWDAVPHNTPIATASSYHNVSSGTETWIQVLSVANTGVVVDTWDGEQRSWILHANQHIAMPNTSQADITYEAVAVTATGVAFEALSKNCTDTIEPWQLNDDFINWASTGAVDIGTAWK